MNADFVGKSHNALIFFPHLRLTLPTGTCKITVSHIARFHED